jgi:heme exporter protein B
MTNCFKTALALFLKDLKIEFRQKEIFSSTFLLVLLITLLCAFAFDPMVTSAKILATGTLWIALCLSCVTSISRIYQFEKEFNAWNGLLLSGASRTGIYLGKTLGLLAITLSISMLLLPVLDLFFKTSFLLTLHLVFPVLFLGILALSLIGALLGVLVVNTQSKDLLLGIILLPLISPVLILGVKACQTALETGYCNQYLGYLKLLLSINIIFSSLGIWLFKALVED